MKPDGAAPLVEIPKEERGYLRGLATRQAEIAALPIMRARRQAWTDMNDGKRGTRPPFVIQTSGIVRELLPASILRCRSEFGRRLEQKLLRNLRQHEVLNDDRVCPEYIDMQWHVKNDEFGVDIRTTQAFDVDGRPLGYRHDCPINDLKDGFDMLKPSKFEVERDATEAERTLLEELFGDIMPVVIEFPGYDVLSTPLMLTHRIIRLMSMETFLLAMYDCPDKLHDLMGYLRDNAVRISRWAEAEGLLSLNNGNQFTCGDCFNFTTLIPKDDSQPGKIKLRDLWAHLNSQETVGVSPEKFHEFFFPYYRDLAEMFGLIYYGCCEPIDPIWETSISNLPNLKAVSISRWANQEYMAEALDGTGIVYSRKPNPNLLSVDVNLNEDAWAAEIRTTLEMIAGKDVNAEFVVRDLLTVHGNLGKARRAVEIAMSEIDKFYPPLAA